MESLDGLEADILVSMGIYMGAIVEIQDGSHLLSSGSVLLIIETFGNE